MLFPSFVSNDAIMKEAIVGEQFQQLAVFDKNLVNSFKVPLLFSEH
jgi:hypothetical protein